MLLISIEKRRIDNIIIIGNELLFSDIDKETDEAIYTEVPVNEYEENSDYYHLVQSYLYDEEYLSMLFFRLIIFFLNFIWVPLKYVLLLLSISMEFLCFLKRLSDD